MPDLKTRSPLYLRHMSDEVKSKVNTTADQLKISNWLLVEKILEDYLGIKNTDSVDVTKFIGTNRHTARLGKPYKKKASK